MFSIEIIIKISIIYYDYNKEVVLWLSNIQYLLKR